MILVNLFTSIPIEICITQIENIMQKHNLVQEFPQHADRIHELKTENTHFRKLFDEYHELDHEIHKIEEGLETVSDEYLHKQRAHRVYLKDELYKLFSN